MAISKEGGAGAGAWIVVSILVVAAAVMWLVLLFGPGKPARQTADPPRPAAKKLTDAEVDERWRRLKDEAAATWQGAKDGAGAVLDDAIKATKRAIVEP